MSVDPAGPLHAEYDGCSFHFCSEHCQARFETDPGRYAGAASGATTHPAHHSHPSVHAQHGVNDRGQRSDLTSAEPEPDPESESESESGMVDYTCPMHPEIRQPGPGSCPVCGMALEPVMVTADTGPSQELVDMTRRFWVGLILAVPVFLLEMGSHLFSWVHDLISPTAMNWVQLVLATPVVLWAGWPFFVRGWISIRTRNLNMFTLIAMGTGVAWLYSVVATLASGIFPDSFRQINGMAGVGTVDVYFEAAAVITVLVLLELRAREQTSGAIRALLDLTPKTARRVNEDGAEEEIGLQDVQLGDRLRVRPGEAVPVDGTVEGGRSFIDESLVTGESMPVTKTAGDTVIGGTINQSGGLVMRAEKLGRDTMLARIVAMVADAQRSRAPIQRMADRVAGVFAPVVIGAAVLAFIIWALAGPDPKLAHGLIVAVAILIIACPCALGLASPRHADVDHGRRRTRRRARRAHQKRRGPRTDGEGQHPGHGQDRHPHRRPAFRHRDRASRRVRRCRDPAPGRRGRTRLRTPAGPRHRPSRPRPATHNPRRAGLRLTRRPRRASHRRGPHRHAGQLRLPRLSPHRHRRPGR